MKKILYTLSLVVMAFLYVGCSTTDWGVARLPDARTLFISTAQEQSFVAKKSMVIPYQPVGYMGIRTLKFQACGGNLTGTYASLERAINNELIDKAKNELGGEAVIDYKWKVTSSWQTFLEMYQQAAQTDACAGSVMTVMAPFAYVFNVNSVFMTGEVVKRK